jgi:cobalt-precorrin-5B (C1)-methyltransferase
MEMICSAIAEACALFSYTGGIRAIISIPGGADIAKRTMNERLGIVGGLSILGTTGIVEPMSERAIIETIKTEIDVQTASGRTSLLVTPGNYGREFAEKNLGINIEEAIKCSNFIGDMLDYACIKGIEKITLIGHAGKLVKLAGGVMNTHSSIADCRMEIIAAHCALAGAGTETIRQIMTCITVEAALVIIDQLGISDAVWKSIGQRIGFHLRERTRGSVAVEYIVFTQEHGVLIHSNTERV